MFKVFLYHAEFEKNKSNCTVVYINEYEFFRKCKPGLFTSVATMVSNNMSCIRTFINQYIIKVK